MEAKILGVPSTPLPFVINWLILSSLTKSQRASNGTEAFPATTTIESAAVISSVSI